MRSVEEVFLVLEKNIERLKKDFFEEKDEKKEEQIRLSLIGLEKILKYVESYDWYTKKNAKNKIDIIKKSNFEYKLVKKEIDIKRGSYDTFLWRSKKRLNEKIGETSIDLILQGKPKVGVGQFYILSGYMPLSGVVKKEILDKLPNEEFKPDFLINCKEEISLLYDYSEEILKKRLEAIDKGKMGFIRYILEHNTPKFSQEKYDLMRLLIGKGGTKEEYFEKLDKETKTRG